MSAAQETPARGIDTDVAALRRLEPDRAFERMYRKHATEVYRYALAIVRDATDAEDVTQTTFLNAFRAMQRGERPQKAKSWLLAIAHNVCLQRFRNASRRPQQVAFDEELAEAAVPDESPGAEDLVRALQALSFNQRSALVMRELEGRSYADIGAILGLPVSAVETLLFRARRALREQLETSITCSEAEELLSRQLDGQLPRSERGALRAHIRSCEECAHLARSQRAQRSAWKALSIVPLPGSLSSLFGGGGSAVATGVAAKVAAVGAAAVLVGGGTYEGVRVVQSHGSGKPARTAPIAPSPASHAAPAAARVSRASRPVELATHGKTHATPSTRSHGRRGHARLSPGHGRGQASAPGQAKKAASSPTALPSVPAVHTPRGRAAGRQAPRERQGKAKKHVEATASRSEKTAASSSRGNGHANGHANKAPQAGSASAGSPSAGARQGKAPAAAQEPAAQEPDQAAPGKKR